MLLVTRQVQEPLSTLIVEDTKILVNTKSSYKIDLFNNLPNEIILKILSYLDLFSLQNMSLVNRQGFRLTNDWTVGLSSSRKLFKHLKLEFLPQIKSTESTKKNHYIYFSKDHNIHIFTMLGRQIINKNGNFLLVQEESPDAVITQSYKTDDENFNQIDFDKLTHKILKNNLHSSKKRVIEIALNAIKKFYMNKAEEKITTYDYALIGRIIDLTWTESFVHCIKSFFPKLFTV